MKKLKVDGQCDITALALSEAGLVWEVPSTKESHQNP